MMADDPCVGIGRLENGEEARRGREKRTLGAQEGTCVVRARSAGFSWHCWLLQIGSDVS